MAQAFASPASRRPPRTRVTCWAIIPVKGPDQGKLRLSGVLDEAQRRRLVRAMLAHVVTAAESATTIGRTCILGPSRHGLDAAVAMLSDPGGGLNAALTSALAEAERGGASRAVFVAGDLPQASTLDIELLAAAPQGSIAIAPDRHGTGTNALSLPLPGARDFMFAFGPDSFAAHHGEAERLGLKIEEIHSPGLMRDIDVPDDLPDAASLPGG